MSTHPYELTVSEAAVLLRRGELHATELVDSLLDRIRAVDPDVRAFTEVFDEEIRSRARHAPRPDASTPLAGIPLAYKNLFHLDRSGRGVPGSLAAALSRSGAGVLGRTEAPALFTTESPTRNPWDLAATPGWSSGGSAAAVAAGMAPVAFGTDNAGSVRMPAAMCGVVGFKPTFGLLPMRGVTRMSTSLDHAGVLARDVADVELVMRAAGVLPPPGAPPRSRAGGRVVVGVPQASPLEPMDPDVDDAYRSFLDRCGDIGVELTPVTVPWPADYGVDSGLLVGREIAWLYRRRPGHYGRAHESPELREAVADGRVTSVLSYRRAAARRARFARAWTRAVRRVDVLALPSVRSPALPVGVEEVVHVGHGTESTRSLFTAACLPFNLGHAPALSVPAGRSRAGLPIGVQLAGRPGADAAVLRVGRVLHAAVRESVATPVEPVPCRKDTTL